MNASIRTLGAVFALSLASGAAAETRLVATLKLSAEERYDDAVLLRTGAGAGQLMSKLSPQVGLSLADETLQASTWYSPDLLIHHGSGSVTLDHRGSLELKKKLSRETDVSTRAQVWRVSDPTSLPRLGVARTLSPILYGKLDLGARTSFTERFEGRLGYKLEAAKIYEADRLPGFYHAPSVEGLVNLTRRTVLGAEYRFQYFSLGAESAHAHGAFATLRHRITRQMLFTAQAAPVFFQDHQRPELTGVLPRLNLELAREGEHFDVAVVGGEDLVGASGFTSALWADYASLTMAYRLVSPVKLFAATSYYRNGRAPTVGLWPQGTEAVASSQGYAVGGGVEWKLGRNVAAVGSVERFAQVDGDGGQQGLVRNIAAVRLVVTTL